jgi:hypothetical protein
MNMWARFYAIQEKCHFFDEDMISLIFCILQYVWYIYVISGLSKAPVSAGSLKSIFPLLFDLPYFIEEFRRFCHVSTAHLKPPHKY